MTEILIKKCSDPALWYADLVGKFVPYINEDENYYISRNKEGQVLLVNMEDAEVYE